MQAQQILAQLTAWVYWKLLGTRANYAEWLAGESLNPMLLRCSLLL